MLQTVAARIPAAVDYERTLVLAIEVSNKSWVLAAQVPGLPHTKAKRTIDPQAEALLAAVSGYRARMRDSGWGSTPAGCEVCRAKPAETRAPPWITVFPHQLLTEIPSCEAEYMAAPERFADKSDSSCTAGANGMDPALPAGRMSDVDCSEGESSCRSFG